MKFLFMKIILFTSTSICFFSNPMSMGFFLLIYSFLISFFISKIMLTSWFCYITMLMMIGGILIIFMYISSISSNESFKFNNNMNLLFMIFMFMIVEEFMLEFQVSDFICLHKDVESFNFFSVVKLYNSNCMFLTVFLIIYLIFSMIVVSNIVKHFKGPLRSLNYE
uniref:NADH dehydrogenase subunit 6 n=1 Tax=Dusuna sp. TaxID=3133678 RepID=A0AAU6PBZ5_9HEMI